MPKVQVLRIPYDDPIPEGWQDWSRTIEKEIALPFPRWRAIRGSADAPVPEGAKSILARDELPDEVLEHARRLVEEMRAPMLRAASVPEHEVGSLIEEWAVEHAAAWMGEPADLAHEAPLSIASHHEAVMHSLHAPHLGSRTRYALVRRDPRGWRVWSGIGSDMEHAGHRPTWKEAVTLAIDAVISARHEEEQMIREHYQGWADEFVARLVAQVWDDAPVEIISDDGHGNDRRTVAMYEDGRLEVLERPEEDGPQEIAVVRMARKSLRMSQERFGRWLAEQLGREEPYPQQQVSEWERGLHVPRPAVRALCARVAAEHIAQQAAEMAKNAGASDDGAEELRIWLEGAIRDAAS